MSSSAIPCERRTKKPSNRPAIQIYRPPGLRSGEDATNSKPTATAGAKQLRKDSAKRFSEDSNNTSTSRSSFGAVVNGGCIRKSTEESDGSLPRADSALSNDSSNSSLESDKNSIGRRTATAPESLTSQLKQQQQHQVKRSGSRKSSNSLAKTNLNGNIKHNGNDIIRKDSTNVNKAQLKDNKKKNYSPKDIEDLTISLRHLSIAKENIVIEQFISGNFEDEKAADALAQVFVHHCLEENKQAGKNISRIAGQIVNLCSTPTFYRGMVASLLQYFECRDQLRLEHSRVWITFLNFVSDLYASVGYVYEGELVNLIFRLFDYILKAPVLEDVKIEELESLIACLLSVGYDLERQCPEQLAVLKDLIRDAFIEVQEPWQRKMILLLMELGASSWKLPTEANEYYFQNTNH
uniref:MIF4G domain-containing protein n=1 Tax=Syphacia muris TaxID=451379 RepID=A0A0N5AJD8_9BILA